MGRTLPSAAMLFQAERANCAPFRQALSPSDRRSLDELFVYAQMHIAESAYAAHPLPMQVYLLSMILEDHKELIEIRAALAEFDETPGE